MTPNGMMITSTSKDQYVILNDIIKLHNDGQPFELDCTYSKGSFYKWLPKPRIRADMLPTGNIQADVTALPILSESIQSVVFDPPFVHASGKKSIIGNRFGSYKTQRALRRMYSLAIPEIVRVLRPTGLLVVKCQDIVESSKQVWNHIYMYDLALQAGMTIEDLFIYINHAVMIGWNHGNQQHARKTHSYFWVFRK